MQTVPERLELESCYFLYGQYKPIGHEQYDQLLTNSRNEDTDLPKIRLVY